MAWLDRIYSDLRSSHADQIYDYILTQIFLGQTPPGHRLMENQIARHLGVGIGHVHETVIRLRDEGWIELIPHGGARVINYHDPHKHRQLYDMRISLESGIFFFLAQTITSAQAAELEAIVRRIESASVVQEPMEYRRQDAEFYMKTALFAGGARLITIYRCIFLQWSVMMDRCRQNKSTQSQSEKAHRAIFSALKAKDSTLAAELVRHHIPMPECQI
ncbi:MAG: GntR family transcriptional regulator [Sedimentisphaerales bacterium]|nr:GntR family transcriptional regulator [Sedimentisphaerales bacterium]